MVALQTEAVQEVVGAVSYTHLDVYKRQARDKLGGQKGKSPDLQLRSQSALPP